MAPAIISPIGTRNKRRLSCAGFEVRKLIEPVVFSKGAKRFMVDTIIQKVGRAGIQRVGDSEGRMLEKIVSMPDLTIRQSR
jgi:hypothetical protein